MLPRSGGCSRSPRGDVAAGGTKTVGKAGIWVQTPKSCSEKPNRTPGHAVPAASTALLEVTDPKSRCHLGSGRSGRSRGRAGGEGRSWAVSPKATTELIPAVPPTFPGTSQRHHPSWHTPNPLLVAQVPAELRVPPATSPPGPRLSVYLQQPRFQLSNKKKKRKPY